MQWARGQSERGVKTPIVILSSCEKSTLDSMVDSIREETGLDIQAREGRPESADDLKMVSAQDAHNIIIMCGPYRPQYSCTCACHGFFSVVLGVQLRITRKRPCVVSQPLALAAEPIPYSYSVDNMAGCGIGAGCGCTPCSSGC